MLAPIAVVGLGGSFIDTIYPLIADPFKAFAAQQMALSEATSRWLSRNPSLADAEVRVALIDPDGKVDGPPALTFQVNDSPVATQDGDRP